MQHQQTSVVYHLDTFGRIPPGRLIDAEDHEGGVADIYLHPLHVREALVWQLNWLNRQMVGFGHWRQRWTDGRRMRQAAEGLGIAVSRWEIVPAHEMPTGCHVFPNEADGSAIWLIRSGSCTRDMEREMNGMLERIAGDGLWLQAWAEGKRIPACADSPAPLVGSPVLPMFL